jgi:hypothetical protein
MGGTYSGSGKLAAVAKSPYQPVVHCVDIFDSAAGSHYGSISQFEEVLGEVCGNAGNGASYQLHACEWSAWAKKWDRSVPIDLLWLDGFNRETFELFWPLVSNDGGMCILHSTLNNHRNHAFIMVTRAPPRTSSRTDP